MGLLDGICEKLDKNNADHCKHVVDDYYMPAFNFLRHEIDPHLLCSLVGLCKSQPSLPAATVQQTALVPATKLTASSSQCEICQFAATELFSILEDPYDQRMVKNALESICYRLPNVVDRRCEQFVEGYTAKILDLITSGLGPDQLCLALNICSETREVAPVEEEEAVGDQCVLCEYVVSTLDKMVTDKANEAQIKQALDVLCYGLSAPVHKECIKLIDQYTDELVDMIVKEYPPNVICNELGLCVDHEIASNAIPPVYFETIQVAAPLDNSVSCEMCEFAISVIDERLDDEATIDQIEREVQFVCSYLPGSIGDKCEELVDKYGEKLIDALVKEEMDPKKVCSQLLPSCASGKSAKRPCVWGPEMWCASPFHARVCGATSQCGF